jgi:hypothetical protein
MGSRGVRPRRGALRLGSRQVRAAAAACLAAGVLAAVVPSPASAFPCGDRAASAAQGRHLTAVSTDECRSPETIRPKPPPRKSKKGSMSTLTVFVLAIVGALLIPIGRNGLPRSGDPFGHDPTHEPLLLERKSTIK